MDLRYEQQRLEMPILYLWEANLHGSNLVNESALDKVQQHGRPRIVHPFLSKVASSQID